MDELIKGLDNNPEGLSLFICKKFYDNSYFTNDPVNYFLISKWIINKYFVVDFVLGIKNIIVFYFN